MSDDICRECGGVMNCQHCHGVQLPVDRHRIAELEALLRETLTHDDVAFGGLARELKAAIIAAVGT